MIDELWSMAQRSRALQNFRTDIQGIWRDNAAADINNLYLNPHEDLDDEMRRALDEQKDSLDQAQEAATTAHKYGMEAVKLSQQVEKFLEEIEKDLKIVYQQIELFGRSANDARAKFVTVKELIARANGACGGKVEQVDDEVDADAQSSKIASPSPLPGLVSSSLVNMELKATAAKEMLKLVSPNLWESPVGLRYDSKSKVGDRIWHVLRHSENIPHRQGARGHGVFEGDPKDIILLIDEAWNRRNDPDAWKEIRGTREVYFIPMGRRVGYVGGQIGAKLNHPDADYIQIIVENNINVISAFPIMKPESGGK